MDKASKDREVHPDRQANRDRVEEWDELDHKEAAVDRVHQVSRVREENRASLDGTDHKGIEDPPVSGAQPVPTASAAS